MELSSTTFILVGVVCVALGFLASVLLNTLSDDSDGSGTPDTPPGGKQGAYEPLARLWRDKSTHTLLVEVDGKTYQTPEALPEEQRQQLMRAAPDLLAWLGMSTHDVRSEVSIQPRVQSPVTVPGMMGAPRQVHTANRRKSTPEQPVVEPQFVSEMGSIVTQINDQLQQLLAVSPLAGQKILLMEDPVRGVVVVLGEQFYQGIDAVPEGEAKHLLRAAVRQWENSHG